VGKTKIVEWEVYLTRPNVMMIEWVGSLFVGTGVLMVGLLGEQVITAAIHLLGVPTKMEIFISVLFPTDEPRLGGFTFVLAVWCIKLKRGAGSALIAPIKAQPALSELRQSLGISRLPQT
jgi:hypothetical protein